MRQPLNIVFVILDIKGGGSERIFSYLSNDFCELGHSVTLVLIGSGPILYDLDDRINLIFLNKRHLKSGVFALFRTLNRIKPDVVLSTLTYINMVTGLWSLLFGHCSYTIARESTVISKIEGIKKSFWYYKPLIRLLYRGFNLVVAQSRDMSQELHKLFKVPLNKLIIIPNGIAPREGLVKRENKDIVFVTVAMLRPEKRIPLILRCLARLNIPFKYYIVGEGRERGRYFRGN